MALDTIAALQLIGNLFISITGQLNKIKGTPKQRFARDVVALSDILERAEKSTAEIILSLNKFESEKTIGMQVNYIHATGKNLEQFSNTCEQFTRWIEKHENLSGMLQILAPEVKGLISEVTIADLPYTKGGAIYLYLKDYLSSLQESLQATRSPNPKKFPTDKFVSDTIEEFNQLIAQIRASKKLLQEFASSHLTIDDFF